MAKNTMKYLYYLIVIIGVAIITSVLLGSLNHHHSESFANKAQVAPAKKSVATAVAAKKSVATAVAAKKSVATAVAAKKSVAPAVATKKSVAPAKKPVAVAAKKPVAPAKKPVYPTATRTIYAAPVHSAQNKVATNAAPVYRTR
jgi:hypothetical protein